MCEARNKYVALEKEYTDVLHVPDNGSVLEEFVKRDVANNLAVAKGVRRSSLNVCALI